MIHLTGLTKSFEGQKVILPLDLTISRGETAVLIGPSGCGKSTLLRLITGLIRPDTGTIHIDGLEMNPAHRMELIRRMGFVIQSGGLFPHLTARENTVLMARYLGWSKSRLQKRVESLSALTHFPKDALDRYPVQLSGGQQQRVSLMRGLMLDPAILLLDEPLGALDPLIRADLQRDMREIFDQLEKTVVLVTHDMGEAAYFGSRILVMRQGRLVQDGPLEDLLKNPEDPFVTRFINAQREPWRLLEGK